MATLYSSVIIERCLNSVKEQKLMYAIETGYIDVVFKLSGFINIVIDSFMFLILT